MNICDLCEELVKYTSRNDFFGQINCLYQLHTFINKELFNGVLREDIKIDICNLNKSVEDTDNIGGYERNSLCVKDNQVIWLPAIKFAYEVFDELEDSEDESLWDGDEGHSKQEVLELIVEIMLHEMIHQYCHENGIDDSDHNANFIDTAGKFGLISYYDKGKLKWEYIGDDTVRRLGLDEIYKLQF